MIDRIKRWQNNPKRDYAEGLAIFNKYASREFKDKYGNFLALKEGEKVGPFDMRMSVLIKQITQIAFKVSQNPDAYKDDSQPTAPDSPAPSEKQVEDLKKIVVEKQTEIELLNDEKTELEADAEGNKEKIVELEEKIESLKNELKEKVEKAGLKVVTYADMPKNLQKLYDRTKEIVPLMAKLHAEISVKNMPETLRKKLSEDLCKLDDERRAAWDTIDEWAYKGDVVFDQPKKVEYSNDEFVRGLQIGKRIERCKEGINRAEKSIAAHKRNGNTAGEAKSTNRKERYEAELAELQKEIDEKK